MQPSIVDPIRSQAFQTTEVFFSNRYPPSNSYLLSLLFPTLDFLTQHNNDDKALLESVRMSSGSADGGGLTALIAILGLCALLCRRHKAKVPQNDNETVDEFDLPTEHSDAEEISDEEENGFDLQDRSNSEDLLDCDHWEDEADALRMHFDREETFQLPNPAEPRHRWM
jgi:hypothetical protein